MIMELTNCILMTYFKLPTFIFQLTGIYLRYT